MKMVACCVSARSSVESLALSDHLYTQLYILKQHILRDQTSELEIRPLAYLLTSNRLDGTVYVTLGFSSTCRRIGFSLAYPGLSGCFRRIS